MGSAEPSILDRFTLGEIKAIADELGVQGIVGSIKRFTTGNYQQFVEVLCSDLNDIILNMQENAELRKDDSEDRLTIEIASVLRGMGYDAGHETKIGGHTDLTVRGRHNYLWIGEAKIHSSYDYLFQGFQQLCTRYATGDTNQDCGGLIIYIKNKNSAAVVKEWRKRLTGYGLVELTVSGSAVRPNFEFTSCHKLDRSGSIFRVKHIGVSLYFDPKDKHS
ncbi:hypothetical protein C4K31_5093 [Pseudomonas chlororaphis subsp. piscium]|uniref:hypothetical protein n=1 Tax=Pseudomonas chlororaphis TaxID=587753 RepID=UPI000F57ABEB|nr:hypothetical protein [Pseudomonas chlororaphis]AZC77972.1 hypothetical protein C4K31_5093 [Pseudomonas chlororaphis subsp. piscium]